MTEYVGACDIRMWMIQFMTTAHPFDKAIKKYKRLCGKKSSWLRLCNRPEMIKKLLLAFYSVNAKSPRSSKSSSGVTG